MANELQLFALVQVTMKLHECSAHTSVPYCDKYWYSHQCDCSL